MDALMDFAFDWQGQLGPVVRAPCRYQAGVQSQIGDVGRWLASDRKHLMKQKMSLGPYAVSALRTAPVECNSARELEHIGRPK